MAVEMEPLALAGIKSTLNIECNYTYCVHLARKTHGEL